MARSWWGRGWPGALLIAAGASLSACTMTRFDFAGGGPTTFAEPLPDALPLAAGETFGVGPVRVALLLPLTGGVSDVGVSMANGARLAMSFIEANPNIAENITIVLKDTGDSPAVAAQQASAAIAEGASLILGPLRADQVTAAGAVARSAGVPIIGFSNNSAAAQPGIFLLNVLPEAEVRRSLLFARAQGRGRFAGIFPTTEFGRVQEASFRQVTAELGLPVAAVFNFTGGAEAASAAARLGQMVAAGEVDAVFLPDRTTAPAIAGMLGSSGAPRDRVTLIGSVDWDGDAGIAATPFLAGAFYPAVDESGYNAILPEYQARFGTRPHRFATLSYTATILANAAPLSMSTPRYDRAQLTLAGGFNGRDGVFRFLPDGRSQYALVIKSVAPGGATRVDGPKL